jgi:major type 1 subunit fimbrin (pilin)
MSEINKCIRDALYFLKESSMKKNLIAVAVLATSAFASTAFAADGQVNFVGSITDAACTVDTDSLNQSVTLGKVAKTAFTGAGSTAAAKQFSLKLKDCPATVTGATVRFDGTQVPGNNAVLELTDTADKATGVGIQLSDNQNNVINLYQDSAVYPLVSTGVNTLNFTARYYATAADVTVGSANAVTNFTVVYQ